MPSATSKRVAIATAIVASVLTVAACGSDPGGTTGNPAGAAVDSGGPQSLSAESMKWRVYDESLMSAAAGVFITLPRSGSSSTAPMIHGLDAETGKKRWEFGGDGRSFTGQSVLGVLGTSVIVKWTTSTPQQGLQEAKEQEELGAVKAETGELLWHTPLPQGTIDLNGPVLTTSTKNPTPDGSKESFGSTSWRIQAIDPGTGKPMWTRDGVQSANTGRCTSPTALLYTEEVQNFKPGSTFVESLVTKLEAVDPSTGQTKWTTDLPAPGAKGPEASRTDPVHCAVQSSLMTVVGNNSNYWLYSMDLSTGNILGSQNLSRDGGGFSSLYAAGDQAFTSGAQLAAFTGSATPGWTVPGVRTLGVAPNGEYVYKDDQVVSLDLQGKQTGFVQLDGVDGSLITNGTLAVEVDNTYIIVGLR